VKLIDVPIEPRPIDQFEQVLTPEQLAAARQAGELARERMRDRAVWNVNSTAVGGGVAEMLRPLLAYAQGLGVDARWVVIQGEPAFFEITKRLHNALHGANAHIALDTEDRRIYEQTLEANARELSARIHPRDVVVLHDPQTVGLAAALRGAGARVVWRCHIGTDDPNHEVERAWAFLEPYLRDVHAFVFSRRAYVPDILDPEKTTIIRPSIDAFGPKNQHMDPDAVHAILVHVGLVEGPGTGAAPRYIRSDGTPADVLHKADLIRMGRAPGADTPLVVQVSRWDRLKDPIGVLEGFGSIVNGDRASRAQLVLAGPNVNAVADDPEGDIVFREVLQAWRDLPHFVRDRITLASLPTTDIDENAAIVNALQRHASVIVQKSLREGFGLTVTEGMWKAKPVVASAVGGILDQIEDGTSGILLQDPQDRDAFAHALRELLNDPQRAAAIGQAARERVREKFLGVRHLLQYHELLASLDAS
jgi:trehalose synthase